MANDVLKLAFEVGGTVLREQDTTLSSLRSRATGLLAAAALGISIATGVGLYTAEPGATSLPGWAGWLLLGQTLIIGGGVLYVCSPISDWKFGLQAPALLKLSGLGDGRMDEFYQGAATVLGEAAEVNDRALRKRFTAYRMCLMGLTVQAVTLIVAVLLR